jgi:hypothetical protein
MGKVQVSPLRNGITASNLVDYAHYTGLHFRDSVTGDLCWIYGDTGGNNTYLVTQTAQDTPTLVATVTNSYMTMVASAQDASGYIHFLCYYSYGLSYAKGTLTRSGGHVTGLSLSGYISLPSMTSPLGGSVWSCTIAVIDNGNSAERVAVVVLDADDATQYAAAVCHSSTSPTQTSDFVSLAGTASTWTKYPTQTASANVGAAYTFNASIEQYGSSGNFFVSYGPASRGDVGDYSCATIGYRAIASGANWTVDTANQCVLAAETDESLCGNSCVDSSGNAYFAWTQRATTGPVTVGLSKIAANGTFTASWVSTTTSILAEAKAFPAVCSDGTVILAMAPGDTGSSGTLHEIQVYSGSSWYSYYGASTRANILSWIQRGSRGWQNGIVWSSGDSDYPATVSLGSVHLRTGAETGVLYDNYSLPAYSATATISPAYATAVPNATRDMHVCVVGQKSTSTSGGTITFPSGWTGQGSKLGAGGYSSQGVDTGNVDIAVATKDSANGAESGTISVTLGSYNTAWAMMVRLTRAGDGDWAYASTTGSDITGGAALSVTYDSAIALAPGDLVVIGWCQPTDVTTPRQFTAQAISADGITFSEVTVLAEPDSDVGNDIGGWVGFARVLAGTGSVTPIFSATASDTTTNVRGGSVLLRLREAASEGVITSTIAAVAGGPSSVAAVQTQPPSTAAVSAVAGGPGSALLVQAQPGTSATVTAMAGGPSSALAVQAQLPVSANVSATAGGPGSALLATTSPMIAASVAAAAGGPISAASATLTVDAAVAAIGGGPISSAVVSTFPETSSAVVAVAGGPTSGASVEFTIVSTVAGIAGGPVSAAVAENEPFASVAVAAVAGGPTSSAAVSSPLYVAVSATAGGPVAAMIATNAQRIITAGDGRRFSGVITAGDSERT